MSFQRSLGESHSEKKLGNLVSGALSGVWRESPPTENFSPETLALITPLLHASGGAALGWWRIRNSELADSLPGIQLHDAYRRSRLAALIHEREIRHVLSLLRAAGIEPVLVKGWAIARRYPDRALRPYGDIDLCILPDQFEQAEAAVKCLESIDGHYVDLHYGFAKFGVGSRKVSETRTISLRAPADSLRYSQQRSHSRDMWIELFDRSRLVDLGEDQVRVLCDEDHLRVLCVHFLRSGAWRPLWLCDIALALESRGPDFDWERCLGPEPRLADWIACTIGLAHELLGVDVTDIEATPVAQRARRMPRWLVPAVLRQWSRCRNPNAAGMALPSLARTLFEPRELFSQIYVRWDQPLRATVALGGKLSDWLRLPYQIGELILHSPEVPRQLSTQLRERWLRKQPVARLARGG